MKTELTFDDVAAILAPFALKPRKVRAFEVGTVNSNYRVDSDGGALFLRVNEGKDEADVRYEGSLLWHLGARHFPTPQPLRRGDGRPYTVWGGAFGEKWITIFPWTEGETLADENISVFHAAQVGGALGQLHRAAVDFAERRDGIYTLPRVLARVEQFRQDERLRDTVAILNEEAAYLARERAASLPTGTLHGDLFPDNVLWRGPRLAAVLDFEQACYGRFAYDLAVTLNAWCFRDGGFDEGLCRALISSYQSVRPLEAEERYALYAEARVAALRFTITRITDVFLPSADRAGKDFRDYLVRLQRLRDGGAELVHAWIVS